MSLRGQVENGVVVFPNGAPLPDGTLVEVTPLLPGKAGPEPVPVSKERREALLGLIGMWKVEHAPKDEEVRLMRVLLDTNVLLDSILQRAPWHQEADAARSIFTNSQLSVSPG